MPLRTGLLVLIATSAAAAQDPINEQLISLSSVLEVRSPAYTAYEPGSFIIFEGGPLVLTVTLSNFTERDLLIRSGRSDWTEALSVAVRRLEDDSQLASPKPTRVIRARANERPSVSRIRARQADANQFVIQGLQPFEPGNYVIEVQIHESELHASAGKTRNILKREVRFKVVAPRTRLERADQLLQRSTDALSAGKFALARQLAQQVLELKPDSIAALSDLASSYRREGNCTAARPFLNRILDLINSDGDPELNVSPVARRDIGIAVQGRLAQPCP